MNGRVARTFQPLLKFLPPSSYLSLSFIFYSLLADGMCVKETGTLLLDQLTLDQRKDTLSPRPPHPPASPSNKASHLWEMDRWTSLHGCSSPSSTLWDWSLTWESDWPDLTPCFHRAVAPWLPVAAAVFLLTPFVKSKETGKRRRRTGRLHRMRTALVFCLSVVQVRERQEKKMPTCQPTSASTTTAVAKTFAA